MRLAGLIRPLVQRQWSQQVVALNRSLVPALAERDDLDRFLFGAARGDLGPIRGDLRDLQDDACFYCGDRLGDRVDVDHFLPWARHPDEGIHNLVAAHPPCNNAKRDHLAAGDHVVAWAQRFSRPVLAGALDDIARTRRSAAAAGRTLSVARAVYLRLPETARPWRLGDEFVPADRALLASALTEKPSPAAAAEYPTRYDPGPAP